MAFTVRQIWSGRSGKADLKNVRTYTKVFRVEVDFSDITAGPLTVMGQGGLPIIGESYADHGDADLEATCRDIKADHQEDGLTWLVTAEYSSEPIDNTDPTQQQSEDPTARPPKIRWGQAQFNRPLRDLDRRPVTNSANWPFDPLPEIDDARLTLVISRNEVGFSPNVAIQYTNAVNIDYWLVAGWLFEPKVARCTGITTSDVQYENGVAFYEVTYEFQFSPIFYGVDNNGEQIILSGGWYIYILDYGPYWTRPGQVSPGNGLLGPPRKYYSKDANDGTPISGHTLLNGAGEELRDGDPEIYLRFRGYQELPFMDLGLPILGY